MSAQGATTTTAGTLEPDVPFVTLAPLTMSPPHRPMHSTAIHMLAMATAA